MWSYPSVDGDVVATATSAGAKVGPTRAYDRYGAALSPGTPDTLDG